MKALWIRRIYYILLTAALTLAGLCLIAGALHVYYTGGQQIYTLEKINHIFGCIAIPVYIAIALVVGSFILNLILPAPKKATPEKNYAMQLYKLQKKADLNQCGDKQLCKMVLSLRSQRKTLCILSMVMLAVSTAFFLVYALGSAQYPSLTTGHLVTENMIRNTLVWVACLTPACALGIYTAYAGRSSMKTELELLHHVALQKTPPKEAVKSCTLQLNILRGSLIALAIVLIVVGAIGDGWNDVLTKAVAICTECVGLG